MLFSFLITGDQRLHFLRSPLLSFASGAKLLAPASRNPPCDSCCFGFVHTPRKLRACLFRFVFCSSLRSSQISGRLMVDPSSNSGIFTSSLSSPCSPIRRNPNLDRCIPIGFFRHFLHSFFFSSRSPGSAARLNARCAYGPHRFAPFINALPRCYARVFFRRLPRPTVFF